MGDTSSLGDRMKRYERAFAHDLPPRLPVIIRVDGKAFHTYTRGLDTFSEPLIDAMNAAAIALCEHAQTTQLAYVQSDEISLLLHPYRRLTSQPWFDNGIQKICSVAASVAAAVFTARSARIWGEARPAFFDARAFVVPEDEVCNYFVWRQQDAERNSVQMLARSIFSHRECHQKNCTTLRAMCAERGHEWLDMPAHLRRGRCVVRESYEVDGAPRTRWVVDNEPPRFQEERAYVERHLARADSAA